MQDLNIINSIVEARYRTGKPCMSAKLEATARQIVSRNGASEDAINAPSGKLFAAGGPITKARSIINGFSAYLKKRGMPVPQKAGWTYQRVDQVDEIQAEFDSRRDELDVLLQEIRERYPTLQRQGAMAVGALSMEMTWPDPEEFISEFTFSLGWSGTATNISTNIMAAVSKETAARLRASQLTSEDSLKEAHAGVVEDAIKEMKGVIDMLVNGQRLKQARLDKLAAASDELRNKNWLRIPEMTDLMNTLRSLAIDKDGIPTKELRRDHAKKVDRAMSKAEETLSALGV
tara:strand:+ start:1294 stop:2160 length:867 start_codon:yes stop_codon:yes gene_type:complete